MWLFGAHFYVNKILGDAIFIKKDVMLLCRVTETYARIVTVFLRNFVGH